MNVTEHLKNRQLNSDLHRCWVSEELVCATFPLYNLSGSICGYHRYRPDKTKEKNNDPREGRYFTRKNGNSVALWGLESWKLSNTLFVLEGLFDAATVTAHNYSAVATFSNSTDPSTASWLHTVRAFRPVVCVCDNDKAGAKLAKLGHTFLVVKEGKDLNESSYKYVANLLKEYN